MASAAAKTKIYAGIGFNVPGGPRNTDPGKCLQSSVLAFRRRRPAGIVVLREYEEVPLLNLNARLGCAVREQASKKS